MALMQMYHTHNLTIFSLIGFYNFFFLSRYYNLNHQINYISVDISFYQAKYINYPGFYCNDQDTFFITLFLPHFFSCNNRIEGLNLNIVKGYIPLCINKIHIKSLF